MDLRAYPHRPSAIIDFETRSGVSLRSCGVWRYSEDPSTQALCLAFRLPHWAPKRTGIWHPEFPHLDIDHCDMDDVMELLDWIAQGELVEAHNAWFERCVWGNIMVPRFGFSPIAHKQWRCSAARAAALSLPRALDDAINALGLTTKKDMDGSKVMKKMTKPRKPRKAEREAWAAFYGSKVPHERLYHETADMMRQLWAYCRQDVLAEEALSNAIFPLSPEEEQVYLLDQKVNERGFQLDRVAVDAALNIIRREQVRFNKELVVLTKGRVKKATQRAQMLDWLRDEGLMLLDTQKATLDEHLINNKGLAETPRRGLELMRALGRSSTAKYQAMRDWASMRDDRVRGGLLYHGASTGRWSGSGVQPHNFPKGTLKIKDVDALWKTLKRRRRAEIVKAYGDPMTVLSDALRSAITAGPGKVLYVADYAAIEARVLLWLANDQRALDVFRKGEDIYCDMASAIYGRPITKANPDERQLGKVAILGLGYQMGAAKFVDTAASYGITLDDDTAQDVVTTYRDKFVLVKKMWWAQEEAAVQAVATKKAVPCGKVTWFVRGRFLFCQLPSGRRLGYCDPQVKMVKTPWGSEKLQLSYMAINSLTRKWVRQHTYGGMLVENITQAVARDLMANAMMSCEASSIYRPVLSVHDEMIAEADAGTGDVHEFEQLMSRCPQWATGCPVAAEGWSGFRYRK